MKIATWNINSVRLRIQLVTKFLKEHDIDVLCLQETKTQDEQFPVQEIAEAGWPISQSVEKNPIMESLFFRACR